MKVKAHSISIPAFLKVGRGTLGYLGEFLRVCIFFGNGLIELFGHIVFESLEKEDIELLHHEELDTTDIEDITRLAFSIPNNTDAVIGIGGGKVIDVAKYVGFLRKIPFISVPTSSSSDGFSSSSASLLVDGKRTSVPARLALYDWIYEADKGVGELDDFALMIAKKAVNSFIRTPFKSIQDDLFLKELVDSLAMSGIANEIAGNSSPTSGSEHLISHALDKILDEPQLHGVQVGIATYIMSKVQEHRYKRVNEVLTTTGFWNYVKTLKIKREDFEKAIDIEVGKFKYQPLSYN